MVEKILGIDLGISSLGWAVVAFDAEDEGNNRIIDCGVRLFTEAQTPKEKESLNKARREARSLRRVIRRRSVRMRAIKRLFIQHGLLHVSDLEAQNGLFHAPKERLDVWELRHDGLYRLLEPREFARALIHIAKHRGYKFIGDDEKDDEESGKVKKAGAALKTAFEMAGCRSVGEWLWRERGAQGKKRNTSGQYDISISRDLLRDEVAALFEAQRSFGNTLATEALKSAYKEIAFFVRPMQSIEKMVGFCSFFPSEKRAPKAAPSAERFVALTKFFNTVIVDEQRVERKLTELQSIDSLLAFATSKPEISYKALRQFLNLGENQLFKGLHYKGKPKKGASQEWIVDKAEAEKKSWISLKGHAAFKAALGERTFAALDVELSDAIARTLTYYKDPSQKRDALTKLGLEASAVEALAPLSFSNFNNLSLKAIYAVTPEMMQGKRYDEAALILGKPSQERKPELPPLSQTDIDILNPTVIRAFTQFRKVANALVRRYGLFDRVHFELAREINTKAQIKEIQEGQRKNEKERQEAAAWINEHFGSTVPATRKNILKKRLYLQQDGRCAYSGETIALERLFDEGYCEIDHILPRSRSADDSFANKVLCLASENQNKRNQTPFEWFGADEARWQRFEARISAPANRAKMGMGKVNRLLKQNFDESSQNAFIERNLNDTRYMARAIKSYCEAHWQLAKEDNKKRIAVRSGKLTSTLRYQWGLERKNRDEDLTHHGADAVMIAFSTESMVKRLSDYYHAKETRFEKERPTFAPPMRDFPQALETAMQLEQTLHVTTKEGESKTIKRLLVSRPVRASVTGQAHKETIQSPKTYQGRGVAINNGRGMCDNGDMPRVDVFLKEGKYYLVPIYVADFAKPELPNLAIVAGKGKPWIEMDTSHTFLFSLHKDDLVAIKVKNKAETFGYFRGADSSTAGVHVRMIASDQEIRSIGSKTAEYIKKFTIDPLGYYHEVKNEKRLGTITQDRSKRAKQE
ncbi:MAG: type II CRISPR RNA-guided endonuclease Cas9 [Campylobacterales bacterium]|nr:type II CRISPR RNA-guided endonuclease Cas9 [Campylobacterales bacterium]